MTEMENLYLQSLKMSVDTLTLEIAKQRQEAESRGRYASLPEWLDLEQAIGLKRGLRSAVRRGEDDPLIGGVSITFYRQKPFLQPCCGRNSKMVGGRKCWKKDDVIAWLEITDESLGDYAAGRKVSLPDAYKKRSNAS